MGVHWFGPVHQPRDAPRSWEQQQQQLSFRHFMSTCELMSKSLPHLQHPHVASEDSSSHRTVTTTLNPPHHPVTTPPQKKEMHGTHPPMSSTARRARCKSRRLGSRFRRSSSLSRASAWRRRRTRRSRSRGTREMRGWCTCLLVTREVQQKTSRWRR